MENLQLFFFIFLSHFLDFGDITSIFREKAPNAMRYAMLCYAILSESPIQEFALPYGGQVPLEVRRS